MSEITIPAGAFAAAQAGQPQPNQAPKDVPNDHQGAVKDVQAKEDKAPEPEKKLWKLKADGEEFDFDASDEEALKREVMKARGADKRFKEAAQLRKQSEQLFNALRDPKSLRELLSDPRVGVDLKSFAQEYLWEQIQEEQMTPEQKAQRARDREYEDLKKYKEEQESRGKEAARREKIARFEQHYEQKIMEALSDEGLPKDEETVTKMANYLAVAMENGYDLTPKELANYVKQNNSNYYKTYASKLSDDQLREQLGDEIFERVRKMNLGQLKDPRANPFPNEYRKPRTEMQQAPKKLPASAWKDDLIKGFLSRK